MKALGDAARSAIEDDLKLLADEIDGFLREPPERSATLMRRLQTFEDLRSRARLYHSVLEPSSGEGLLGLRKDRT